MKNFLHNKNVGIKFIKHMAKELRMSWSLSQIIMTLDLKFLANIVSVKTRTENPDRFIAKNVIKI
jgi:hypothetical protein